MEGEKSKKEERPYVRLKRMLSDSILPELASQGAFGEGWHLEGIEAVPIEGLGKDHWASTTLVTSVKLSADDGNKRTVALVAKFMLPNDGFEGYSVADIQAENEVNMYNKVFPFFRRLCEGSGVSIEDLHPRHYLARCSSDGRDDGLLSLTLMEDLRARGFRLAKERTALDRKHVSLALRALGRWHAVSYAAKARCREEFMQRVAPLAQECQYIPDWYPKWKETLRPPVMRGLKRLAERFQREGTKEQDTERHRRRLERFERLKVLSEDLCPVMVKAVSPNEPMSALIHGDFCRNNMQFRYDEEDKPVEVCFFDFQAVRYCSPAVDLSLFLFLNTSPEMRQDHWDDLLKEYFDSVKSNVDKLLDGHEVHPDFVMPTLQDVRDDLKQHGLWGLCICAFFLPQMTIPPDEIPDFEDLKDVVSNDSEMEYIVNVGGEPCTEMVADLVLEFLDRDLLP